MAVVLITGCSSGFGLATALAFGRVGDTVFASMRDTSKSSALKAAATEEALDIRVIELDVTRPDTFPGVVDAIVGEAGRLDILVNNAGVLRPGALEDVSPADIQLVTKTNYVGPMLLTRAILPTLRSQGDGYVINISSLSGIAGLPGDVAYTGSKFALEGATEALRHEVDRWGIKVALVQAGLYATQIIKGNLPSDGVLPAAYPTDSPYRPLIEHQLTALRQRFPEAFSPDIVADLVVEIARSDGSQLRWPADDVARRVLATMFAQSDAERDEFLRNVAGVPWWSAGGHHPAAS